MYTDVRGVKEEEAAAPPPKAPRSAALAAAPRLEQRDDARMVELARRVAIDRGDLVAREDEAAQRARVAHAHDDVAEPAVTRAVVRRGPLARREVEAERARGRAHLDRLRREVGEEAHARKRRIGTRQARRGEQKFPMPEPV